MDYVKDKVSIVTGAASGIGRALSEDLARRKDLKKSRRQLRIED